MTTQSIAVIAATFVLTLSYQNCSKHAFESVEKRASLSTSPILGDGDGQPVGDGSEPASPVDIPIGASAHCSDKKTNELESNVMMASKLTLQLAFKSASQEKSQQKNKKTKSAAAEAIANGTIVCSETDTANIRKNLLAGKIIFSKCAAVNGKYEIRLLNENSKDLVVGNEGVSIRAGKADGESVEVLMTSNPEQESELFSQNAEYSSAVKCLKTASPLYVDFRKDKSETDVLSSPEDGVYFDILGANGFPTPYTKSKISWFARGKFALLTLPNFRGEVTNVDQLFGDNTMGPDGEFADNGFHALAKFDLNKDGVIDSSDAVFSKLRLWFDRNRNGIAEPKELESLGLRKLQSIDLKYDPDFYERDKFGNEIKFKSVVRFNDGSLKPIFDVWFRISQ